MIEPVKTPIISLERNSPEKLGTRKIPRIMPCKVSATIRTSQTARALTAIMFFKTITCSTVRLPVV